jgi:cell wall-associated NlpC family hydrolase
MQEASGGLSFDGTSDVPPAPPTDPAGDRQRLLAEAHRLLGSPYEWGAKGPQAFDCSGLTKAIYAAGGVTLPDGSFNQAEGEQAFSNLDPLAPGDLLFYRWAGNVGVTHVTMYAGDGWVIGTGSPGQPGEAMLYRLESDYRSPRTVITYRHIALPDEQ